MDQRMRRRRDAPLCDAELNARIDAMRQTHLVEMPAFGQQAYEEDVEPWILAVRQDYEPCRGLSAEQVASAGDWLARAAEPGDYFAQTEAFQRTCSELLRELSTGLSPTELRWAGTEAQNLLRNPNCCRVP
jgi:hypothetical protein